MTGLNLETDALIEVAVLVTDANLNVLGDGVDVIIKPSQEALDQMSELVTTMHTSSGLLAELSSGITMGEAEEQVLAYVKKYVPEPDKAPLAGNSVGMDRAFLARDMPALESHLHYRNIDVSTIKELTRRWYPKAFFAAPDKHGNHRALGDIKDSITELRYYREAVFVAPPGPGKEASKKIASKYTTFSSESPTGA